MVTTRGPRRGPGFLGDFVLPVERPRWGLLSNENEPFLATECGGVRYSTSPPGSSGHPLREGGCYLAKAWSVSDMITRICLRSHIIGHTPLTMNRYHRVAPVRVIPPLTLRAVVLGCCQHASEQRGKGCHFLIILTTWDSEEE